MKKKVSFFAALLFTAIFGCSLFTVSSCKKSEPSANQQFSAYYYGTSNTSGVTSPDTVQITPGNTGNAVIIIDESGIVANGTVSGNNLTIPYQTVYDNSGSGPAQGSGTLSGTTLNFTLYDTIGLVAAVLIYKGTKQ